MVNSPSLFPDRAETQEDALNFFLYYRKNNGWIVANPGHPNAFASRTKRGWVAMAKYGSFTPGDASVDNRGVPYSGAREGWRMGFQMDAEGFAKEFPVDQIIAYGWHVNPPYKEVTFPQLEGMDIPAYECPECVHLPFYRATDLATHLRVAHTYSRVDIKAYGDEIEVDFTLKAAREETAELAKIASKKLQEQGYKVSADKCDYPGCDWAPGAHIRQTSKALASHRRMAHERVKVPETDSDSNESALERSESDGKTVLQPAHAS